MTDASDAIHLPDGYLVWDGDTITDEAFDKLRSEALFRHNNCIPLFTKDAISEFGKQFKMAVAGQVSVVSVRRLDGERADFRVPPDHPGFHPDSKPTIGFVALQKLARLGPYNDKFCPIFTTHLIVEYIGLMRDRITGEVIPSDIQPIEDVEPYFRRTLTKWEATPACQHLRGSLKALLQRNSNIRKIDKIVAYACGSLIEFETEESGAYPSLAPRPFYQHALVMTVLDVLQNERTDRDAEQIRCYLQDPIYTDAEKDMLAKFAVTVVDDAEGFLLTDDSTAVLSFAPNVPIKQVVLDISLPPMMMWDKVKDEDVLKPWTDPDSPRIRKLIGEHYDEVEFQDYEERFMTSFYVKRAPT
ncbi:hypothetical protein RJZ56_000634 [Blastomyces dermatitidis]|uniref:SRR1-like domain-containing protein n=3 Tax=Blastomyces TaxID=229219 RepID=A0A179UCH8_BLAGS|nr:uncharacterized protein BDBG_01356 [Blastomyces gilchristii SLH14081]XP_045276219.1 uncharacterized protein BDCG_04379 [Blastomyces dermatitidis ER-3]EGE82081.1 hypothetical protein BDDG_05024 [Blastomyces dermatitidis ATCC 18188]EQL33407.1 hypothetical protein BDFG_04557 [Blastomyces dermatitidis ATCC 26199]EEQ89259.1 hypothetical protein BDCG_04379 [Blastomyces dermatitidis ER-3]OAT04867.1 hypothetical protein BDBG_01356 [Blastomyces gilchristii SLH14081]